MPRTREPFQRGPVLDRIADCFWERGYEGTSVEDLVRATGMNRTVLYDELGDKRSMYLLALEAYGRRIRQLLTDTLGGSESARELLLRFIAFASGAVDAVAQRGCMINNAVVELGHRDPAVGALARAQVESLGSIAENVVARAGGDGGVGAGAALFTVLYVGCASLNRAGLGEVVGAAASDLAALLGSAEPTAADAGRGGSPTTERSG